VVADLVAADSSRRVRNEGGGWQKYENGTWSTAQRPEAAAGREGAAAAGAPADRVDRSTVGQLEQIDRRASKACNERGHGAFRTEEAEGARVASGQAVGLAVAAGGDGNVSLFDDRRSDHRKLDPGTASLIASMFAPRAVPPAPARAYGLVVSSR
jgi:hypothetical protein